MNSLRRAFNLPGVFLFALPCAPAQTPDTSPSFEAADVKPNKSGEARMMVDFQPGGRYVARNVPMKVLVALAYHVRPDAIKGPSWMDSERFDVVAKAPQTVGPDEIRRMVISLLKDRFKLTAHTERRESRGFALIVAKSGAKLSPSDATLLTDQRCLPGEGTSGQKHVVCRHVTMAVFSAALQELAPRDIDVPIVDQTGLAGSFDFKFDWVPATQSAGGSSLDASLGPTLFESLENQLGLKLESRKLPLPVIVVDALERTPLE